jgi:hypothetical protein
LLPDDYVPVDLLPDDLVSSADGLPTEVVCASHATQRDHPSQNRGAIHNRTNTSPDLAIRPNTSSSVCRDKRTESYRL